MTFDRNFGRIGNWDTIDIFNSFSNCFEFLNLTWLDLKDFLNKGSFEVNWKDIVNSTGSSRYQIRVKTVMLKSLGTTEVAGVKGRRLGQHGSLRSLRSTIYHIGVNRELTWVVEVDSGQSRVNWGHRGRKQVTGVKWGQKVTKYYLFDFAIIVLVAIL